MKEKTAYCAGHQANHDSCTRSSHGSQRKVNADRKRGDEEFNSYAIEVGSAEMDLVSFRFFHPSNIA